MKDANELRQMLRHHTGTQQVFRHSMVADFNYTEGARAFFREAGRGAYWLCDILATEPAIKRGVIAHSRAFMVLEVIGTKAKIVVARDVDFTRDKDNQIQNIAYDTVFFERLIDTTDCPEGVWQLYLSHTVVGDDEVILAYLPSEN